MKKTLLLLITGYFLAAAGLYAQAPAQPDQTPAAVQLQQGNNHEQPLLAQTEPPAQPPVQAAPAEGGGEDLTGGLDSTTLHDTNEALHNLEGGAGGFIAIWNSLPKVVDSIGKFSLWDTFIYAFIVWLLGLLSKRFKWFNKINDLWERVIAIAIVVAIGYSGLVYDFKLTFMQLLQYYIGIGLATRLIYPLLKAIFGLATPKPKATPAAA